ncbi:MAG: pyruvate kinase [Bacteroidales bacterium]
MGYSFSKTKIVATIGPACSSKEVLREMFREGVDVCRLNFSHSKHEEHKQVIDIIREINAELGTNVAILADLQGPKLRIGEVENNSIMLEEGAEIDFVTTSPFIGNSSRLYMSYLEFPRDVNAGDLILIDDGKLKLEALSSNGKDTVRARVVNGGVLSSKKGVNLPNTKVSLPSLTGKDREDARFALSQDVDWLALSFVRRATDILDLKELMKAEKKHAGIIAKIEKPEALDEIDQIIDMANGIMVARGDLGVEVPYDRVPLIQKMLVKKCVQQAKPVIIATQMMESMITNFRPTRAEANDVANAVLDGADALMLSGETSVGKFPAGVIRAMQQIITYTEENAYKFNRQHTPPEFSRTFLPDSICANACAMAAQSQARTIVTFTFSGYTAMRIASHRPNATIFAFTRNEPLLHKLSLVWGVRAFYYDNSTEIDQSIKDTTDFLKKKEIIADNEVIIHVGSTPINARGQTNMIKLSYA